MKPLTHRRLIVAFFVYVAALLSVPSPARAEDIDIFSINSAVAGQRPNVLIILDSSANWDSTDSVAGGKKYTHVAAAMVSTIGSLTDQFNVGLMMYAETGNPNDNIDGGVMRAGVRQMSNIAPDFNRQKLVNFFSSVDAGFDKSNNTAMGMAFYEAYLYFTGRTAFSGVGKAKRDYNANTWANVGASQQGAPAAMQSANNALWALTGNALTNSSSTVYNSPMTDACQKNFIIYIANGTITDPNASNSDATSKLASVGGDTTTITFQQNDGDQGNISDEWTRFLANTDIRTDSSFPGKQSIVTYAVEVNPVANTQGLNNTELLKSVATEGKGKYFGVTSAGGGAAIADALNQIFAEILSVNSVFAAATLPVNVSVRGFFLNQVYMGVFRPDANSSPRWPGNVKQYALGLTVSGELFVADKRGAPVENTTTGFVSPGAISYWTTTSAFWDNTYYPDTVAQVPLTPTPSDSPDGEFVEKGGAAQHLRTTYATDLTTRKVYTCIGCAADTILSSSASHEFVDSNGAITDLMLGITAAKTVSSPLTRSGTTVTAVSTAHGFSSGAVVQIAGASEGAYNGIFNITVVDANTFTYQIVESPVTPATTSGAMRAAKSSSPVSVVSITRAGTTATVTTTIPHNFTNGQTITITNAGVSDYNGSYVIANAGTAGVSTTFTYTVTETPVTPATAAGTATVGTTSKNIKTNPTIGVTRSGTTVTVETTQNHGFVSGDTVVIAGVTPNDYNGTFTNITVTGNKLFTYTLLTALGPSTPAVGGSADAGAVLTVSGITRSGNIATVTTTADPTAAPANFANGNNNITISGANQSEYNGTFTIGNVNAAAKTFTYTPVPLNPATTATGSITATGSGGVTKPQLVNWVRGANVQLDDNPNVTPTASATRVRGYLHGDVLHSRPAVINYNRASQPAQRDLVVFYGANDGIVHAVKGGQDDLDGNEKWGFIPTEFYDRFSRLYLESPKTSTAVPRTYFADGPVSVDAVFVDDTSTPPVKRIEGTGAKAQLYFGMRRGGRFYYSLDVTDPDVPVFKWKIDNTMTGFGELGQTWSEMRVDKVKIASSACPGGLDSENNCKVLIFGAGYDAAANDPATQGTATMGRGIFVVDAATGALIWHASPAAAPAMPAGAVHKQAVGMDYAIAADVRSVNSDFDTEGVADRIYAADTGGNIWRVNISNADPANWTVGKIASLSGGAAADKRKFLFAPDTVPFNNTTRAILIGSGDREHPFDTTIANRFYMIKDTDGMNDLQTAVTESNLCDLTTNSIQTGSAVAAQADRDCLATSKGWFIRLGTGEKTVGGVTTLSGTTIFATNTPASEATPGSCTGSLGLALIYAVSLTDATSTIDFNGDGVLSGSERSIERAGGGFAPTPVPVLADVPIYNNPDPNDPNAPLTGTGKSGTGQCALLGPTTICPGSKPLDQRYRVFWNLSVDN